MLRHWLLFVATVLLLVLTGCHSDGPTTGGLVFTFAWPAAAFSRDLAGVQSLKVELQDGPSTPEALVISRPTIDNRSSAAFGALNPGTYTFVATAYDATAAAGAILGQARGRVTVAAGTTKSTYLTTAQAALAELTLTPLNQPVYVHHTLPLLATLVNPDNAVVLLPVGLLQWTSNKPELATVSAGGVVTGLAEGDITITASAGVGLSAHAAYTVLLPPATATISANKTKISPGDAVTLTWSSLDADQVISSVNFNTSLLSGSLTVYPTDTTTFKITVGGPGGTATDSVTVTVEYPEPTVSLTASSYNISAGQTVKLTWHSSYATAVKEAFNFNTTALNGEVTLAPTATTTYTLTVKGPGGTKSSSVTVNVSQ
jgi:plastocyanin